MLSTLLPTPIAIGAAELCTVLTSTQQRQLWSMFVFHLHRLYEAPVACMMFSALNGFITCKPTVSLSETLRRTDRKACVSAFLIRPSCFSICRQNNAKNTPLHQAAMVGRAECVVALLEAGADPMIENSNGHSSYQVARLWGQRECARYLQAVQWAATKNKEEIARHHHQKTAEATRRISEHRQRSLQAARSQDAYDDWMAAKGLERSSSASSLAEKHTVSSMLRSRSSMPNIGDASDARSMASSRMSSKCSSLWSVRTAPSSISWTKLDLGDWAKSNMSLASSADSDHFPPPRDGPAKPIVISFRHKRQHQEPLVVPQRPASAHRKRRASTPGLVASRPKSCKKKSTRRDNDLNSGSDESLFRSSSSSDILVVDEHYGLPALRSSARDGGMQSPGPSSIQAWLTGSSYSVGSDSPKEEDGEPSARPSDVAVYLTPPTPSPPQSPTPPPPSSQMAMRPLRANSLRLAFLRTASLTAVQEEPNNSSGDESVGSVEGSLHNYPMQRYLSDNSLALVPSNDLVNFSNDFEFC